MTLKSRLGKLEARANPSLEMPLIIVRVYDGGFNDGNGGELYERRPITSSPLLAKFPGKPIPQMHRRDFESEEVFLKRVYGAWTLKQPVMEMTDQELEAAIASQSSEAARELASTGTIGLETLERIAVG